MKLQTLCKSIKDYRSVWTKVKEEEKSGNQNICLLTTYTQTVSDISGEFDAFILDQKLAGWKPMITELLIKNCVKYSSKLFYGKQTTKNILLFGKPFRDLFYQICIYSYSDTWIKTKDYRNVTQ